MSFRVVALALAFAALTTLVALGTTRAFGQPASLPGFVGTAEIVGQAPVFGTDKLTLGGRLSFEVSARYVRVNLLSLAIPGTDATISAIAATQLFPAGGITGVYDRQTSTYVLWSPSKRVYFQSGPQPSPSPDVRATSAPAPSPAASGDLLSTFARLDFIKNLEAFSETISLAARGTANGHPTTGIDFQLNRKDRNAPPFEAHGRIQFADDLDSFPVQLSANVKAAPNGPLKDLSVRLDITALERRAPPTADFDVPQGYARTTNAGDVFAGTNLPFPMPGSGAPQSVPSPR